MTLAVYSELFREPISPTAGGERAEVQILGGSLQSSPTGDGEADLRPSERPPPGA